jgi:hypothetical protein
LPSSGEDAKEETSVSGYIASGFFLATVGIGCYVYSRWRRRAFGEGEADFWEIPRQILR